MHPDAPTPDTASLFRRLGALLYDSLLLAGVLMIAVLLFALPYQALFGSQPYDHPFAVWVLRLYLLACIAGFFVYFWSHGGQTLGLRAWRLRVIDDQGHLLDTQQAWRRFAWAVPSLLPAGLGLWWCLADREGLAWHDRRSRTRLIYEPKMNPGAH